MAKHLSEAQAQDYICPSTSFAATSFELVRKKDCKVRPCIDYIDYYGQVLNSSTGSFICRPGKRSKSKRSSPTSSIQLDLHLRRGLDDTAHYQVWPLRISGHVIWPSKCFFHIANIHDLLQIWGRTHPAIMNCFKSFLKNLQNPIS